jgi:hypothetical protein
MTDGAAGERAPAKGATAGNVDAAANATASSTGTTCTEGCPQTVTIVITVKRMYNYHDRGTPGKLEAALKGGAAEVTGYTTERPPGRYAISKGVKDYPIPAGTYNAQVKKGSSKNGTLDRPYRKTAVELLNVPNFSDILIHTGNYPKDSEGCIILASANAGGDEMIESSKPKVQELMKWIADVKAKYGEANVAMEVVVEDPPRDAQAPALPKPAKK